jgi:hypothetical protein
MLGIADDIISEAFYTGMPGQCKSECRPCWCRARRSGSGTEPRNITHGRSRFMCTTYLTLPSSHRKDESRCCQTRCAGGTET